MVAPRSAGSEDFSKFMPNEKPGCYVRIGNNAACECGGVAVRKSRYDFDDAALPCGASFRMRPVEKELARR